MREQEPYGKEIIVEYLPLRRVWIFSPNSGREQPLSRADYPEVQKISYDPEQERTCILMRKGNQSRPVTIKGPHQIQYEYIHLDSPLVHDLNWVPIYRITDAYPRHSLDYF